MPDYPGHIQQLVSEPSNESQGKRDRPVWAGLWVDSIGSRPQWAAGRAVQAENNDRRWRPVSEKQIDGIWKTTCALCGKVKKRARGKQN